MRVYGTIQDAIKERLLPGAMVSLSTGNIEILEDSQPVDGNFSYHIPESALPHGAQILTCTVSKRGYHSHTSTYKIGEQDIEISVELIPRLIDWGKVLRIAAIVLAGLLILAILGFAAWYLFLKPEPPPPKITSFEAQAAEILQGGETELKWKTDGKKVFLDGKPVDPSGSLKVNPEKTTTYKLTIKDKKGNIIEKDFVVEVLPPPRILEFAADPPEINLWQSSVLKWNTEDAESLYIIEGEEDDEETDRCVDVANGKGKHSDKKKKSSLQSKPKPKQKGKKKDLCGSITVTPVKTTKYTIVAVNRLGEKAVGEVELVVNAPPEILHFSASNKVVEQGDAVILSWESEGADQAFLNDEQMGVNYSTEVTPIESCTYTLKVRNEMGDRQRSITLLVRQPPKEPEPPEPPPPPPPAEINQFRLSSVLIAKGQMATISWVTQYAEKVYLNGERVEPVGKKEVFPQETTIYELNVVNSTEPVKRSRKIEVMSSAYNVILYEYENFKGEARVYSVDCPELYVLDNDVSSIRILGNCGVRAFSRPGYKGTRQEFVESIPSLRGSWIGNDTISSIQIIKHPQKKEKIVY